MEDAPPVRPPPRRRRSFRANAAAKDGGRDFFRGYMASTVNILMTFPANKLMFRQQVLGSTVPVAFDSLRRDGLHRLYRGRMIDRNY